MHTSAKAGRWVWPSAGQCSASVLVYGKVTRMALYRYYTIDQLMASLTPLIRARSYIHYVIIRWPAQRRSSMVPHTCMVQSRKLLLRARFDFSRHLAPPKITRHTVLKFT